MDQRKIGKLIEKYRKQKKLTQKELANRLGVSNTAVSKWETGNNLPDISMLEPLSDVLEVDILELLKTQKSSHEDTSKKFVKVKKHKLYKVILFIIAFISTICITNTITYSKANYKLTNYKKKETEVYSISTPVDSDIYLSGYIIFNDKNNLVILENITISTKEKIDVNKIKEVSVKVKIGENILLTNKKVIKKDEHTDINKALATMDKRIYKPTLNLKERKNDELIINIGIVFKNNETKIISSSIVLNQGFTNNNNIQK